jgi:RND family efflux transporter MFP subunit
MRTFVAAAAALGAWGAFGALGAAPAAAAGFDCLIEPSQVVEVRSPVDGIVAAVHVKRGDPIRQGQVLVELQSAAERAAVDAARFRAQMEAQVASARNRLDYANAKLVRVSDMQKEYFASAQALDEARAEQRLAESELAAAVENRELAKIEYRRAQEQLALRTMVAPFAGVVVDRMLNPGDLAEAGSGRKPVLKVAQVDPMKVDIVVPASLFGSVKTGARAVVTPRGQAQKFSGRVAIVDKLVDAASGTFVVRVDLANPKQDVPGGLRCSAEIEGVQAPAPLVPAAAPKPRPGG